MTGTYENHRIFRFGDYVLDVDRSALTCNGEEIRLRPKSFDVLRYLVEHRGRVVGRDELLEAVWNGSVVTDDAVTQCLIDIRRAIGDSSQEMIRTVQRRGYIFELSVTETDGVRADSKTSAAPENRRSYSWVAVIAVIAVLGIAIIWPTGTDDLPRDTAPVVDGVRPQPSIAVLPFAVLSDDRSQSYFADGVSEEILNLLARQSGLRVIARTSSFSFRGRDVDVSTIAEQLAVSHVLEGSLRKDGDQIRISVQLVDASSGEYLWTEQFDRKLDASSLFAIQSEVAESVARSLEAELSVLDRQQLASMPTANLEALNAYFEGRAKMETRDPVALAEASALFERAVELDPGFALAYVALSDVYRLRNNYGSLSNVIADQRSEAAVRSALAINDELGEAYASLANVLRRRGEFDAAERAFLRGIELSPNYAPLYQWYAEMLGRALDRTDEAITYAKIAVALDPRSAIIRRDFAFILAQGGYSDDALEQFDQSIDIDPGLALGYSGKAHFLHSHSRIAEAIPLFHQARLLAPTSPTAATDLSYPFIDLGYFDQALMLIEDSVATSPEHLSGRMALAYFQSLHGDWDGAAQNARIVLDSAPGHPAALLGLRDYYLRQGEPEQALELYRQYERALFDEASAEYELSGWTYPNAINLSVVAMQLGRTDFAERVLQACLQKALRSDRDRPGPPGIDTARIYAALGDNEAALASLRRAVDRGWRGGWRYAYEYDMAFADLRHDPEFQSIFDDVREDIARQRQSLEASGHLPFRSAQ